MIMILSFSCKSQKIKSSNGYIVNSDSTISFTDKPIYLNQKQNYKIDSTVIKIENLRYEKKVVYSKKDDKLLLTTPNCAYVFILDLNTKQTLKKIQLKKQSQNFPSDGSCACSLGETDLIESVDFYNDTAILVQTEEKIDIINLENKVVKTIRLNDNNNPKYIYTNLNNTPFKYNSSIDKITLFKYCYPCGFRNKSYYKSSILSYYDVKTDKMEDINYSYPEIYHNYNFGFLDIVYSTEYGDKKYYVFTIDPNIYEFDLKTKIVKVYPGLSSLSSNKVHFFKTGKLKDEELALVMHAGREETYLHLVHNQSINKYFRIFTKPMDLNTARPYYKLHLQVFDESFQILDEFEAPNSTGNYYEINNGVEFISLKKDNRLVFYEYEFE